jgi:2-succinyl-5-enolpyruvyl-6-hydroxy-3-cyclohexene-1-carboxylate synthase
MNFKLDQNLICYFCAGARNHALLDFFQEKNLRSEYDERMASFKALGLAKISGNPVTICTTSGTAVSQTVSALIEARYSQVPLVLISGDRPKKMHGTGAPQTINHRDITEKCVGTYIEVELENLGDLELVNPEFPIHINVLINDTKDHNQVIQTDLGMKDFKTFAQKVSRPLFLVSHELTDLRPLVKKLLSFNLNVYAETLSGAHDLTSKLTEASLLKIRHEFDSVIRIGHTPLSKMWRLLEAEHKPVFSFDARNLPGLSYGQVAPITAASLVDNETFFEIISSFQNSQITVPERSITPLLNKYPQSELSVMKQLQNLGRSW